jgi:hypothetical protein
VKRSELKRKTPLIGGKPLKRRHGLKHKPSRRLELIPTEPWYALLKGLPNKRELAVHHVVEAQEVKRRNGSLWDPRNGLPVTRQQHADHHAGVDRLPLAELRDENFVFAAELLGGPAAYEYLRRRYRGDDPRLDALLNEETA